jgi:hypothetical protein
MYRFVVITDSMNLPRKELYRSDLLIHNKNNTFVVIKDRRGDRAGQSLTKLDIAKILLLSQSCSIHTKGIDSGRDTFLLNTKQNDGGDSEVSM